MKLKVKLLKGGDFELDVDAGSKVRGAGSIVMWWLLASKEGREAARRALRDALARDCRPLPPPAPLPSQ